MESISSQKKILNFIAATAFIFFYLLPFTLKAQDRIAQNDTTSNENIPFIRAAGYTAAYYGGSMFILGKTWYRGREVVPFHFYNDNKGWLQVDKLGHAFGSYLYSYLGYHFLLNSGLTRKEALWYGATLGFILQAPIEIMDGIHEGYGFSTGDVVANFLGSALVFGQELAFRDQVIKFKFSYRETGYARRANGYLGTTTLNRILKDYNGHTYWLSLPVNKLIHKEKIPDWLCLSMGYGAKGMYGEFENITEHKGLPVPETTRYRQFFLSPDIDWTRIKTNSGFLKTIFTAMNFVKFPLPALEYNSKGELKGYWLYF